MESGQLKINSLAAEDSDHYTCRAQSKLVHVETEVKVVVKLVRNHLPLEALIKVYSCSPIMT